MRYRIVAEQVMTTWYVTITLLEPDGMQMVKTKSQYSFDAHETHPDDLVILLLSLAREVGPPQG